MEGICSLPKTYLLFIMKLHLPKLLCAAVMVAMSSVAQSATLTELSTDSLTNKINEDSDGNQLYNVGIYAVANDGQKVNEPHYVPTTHEGDLTLDNKDKLGVYVNDVFHSGSFGSVKGQADKKSDYSSNPANVVYTTNGVVTNNLKITGTLTIKDNAQVNLGGQFRQAYGNNSGVYDEYTGLEATKVLVQGNASLISTKARIETLEIDGGSVKLRTGWTSGNSYFMGSGKDSKQAQILNKLVIRSGSLYMGSENASASQWHQTFAGAIEQYGGTMTVQGNTYFASGLSIKQAGGEMSFCPKNGKVQLSGNASITQSASGHMKFAELYSNSNRIVNITQTGTGIIDFNKGVTYKTKDVASASTINQSGGGTINLSGDFTSADFTVTQTKGTINQKGKMDLVGTNAVGGTLVNSGTLTIADVNVSGTLVNDGTMTINGKATISGKFVNNTNSLVATTLNLVEGGVFENNGTWDMSGGDLNAGTIAGTGTYVYQSDLTLTEGTLQLTLADISDSSPSTFGGTLLDVNSYTLDVASDVTIALAMSGEVETLFRMMLANQADAPVEFTMLVAENVDNWQNLDTAALAAQTEHSAYISGVSYSARDGKVYVSGKLIPEPTTVTLSLMALAALAARRRRK